MRLEGPDVHAFAQRLKEKDQGPFLKKFEENLDDISDGEVQASIDQELFREKQHVDLVTAVASGFNYDPDSKGSDSEFIFHSTDPLGHIKSTGADALLARKELHRIHLCLFICEIGDENLSQWIENVNSAFEMFEEQENRNKIKGQLGFPERDIGEVQYILLARPTDLDSLPLPDIDSRVAPDTFGIWSATLEGETELCHEYGAQIHRDLRDIAENCFDWAASSDNPIQYTIETHPLIPLKRVIYRLVRSKKLFRDDDEPLEFDKSEFRSEYESNLQVGCEGEVRDHLIRRATSDIFELAEQIGIFSDRATKTDRDYRIMFQGNSEEPLDAEKAAEEKFVDLATEFRMDELALERTKQDFDSLQIDLDEYHSDDSSRGAL